MSHWSADELNRLYRYALSLARERNAALDLVQGALLRWLESAPSDVADRRNYVMRIIRNLHFDTRRRDARIEWAPLEEAEPMDLDLAPLEQTIADADELDAVLADLSDGERELLFLWAVEGYTIDEISAHTGAPRGTLLARLHRLRRRIAAQRGSPRLGSTP